LQRAVASRFETNGATMAVSTGEPRLMTQADQLDFTQLSDLLQTLGALQSAAELHGFLVGQLAAGKRLSRSEWLRAANEEADLSQNPDEVEGDQLHALYSNALATLQRGELDFQLLLPEDDNPLLERIENLGQWCQGFLTGFGLAGSHLKIDEELADSLRDLATIAQIGANDDDAALDSSENDLFSITEYVRLAVIEIFWKHHNESAAPTPQKATTPADLFQRNKLH